MPPKLLSTKNYDDFKDEELLKAVTYLTTEVHKIELENEVITSFISNKFPGVLEGRVPYEITFESSKNEMSYVQINGDEAEGGGQLARNDQEVLKLSEYNPVDITYRRIIVDHVISEVCRAAQCKKDRLNKKISSANAETENHQQMLEDIDSIIQDLDKVFTVENNDGYDDWPADVVAANFYGFMNKHIKKFWQNINRFRLGKMKLGNKLKHLKQANECENTIVPVDIDLAQISCETSENEVRAVNQEFLLIKTKKDKVTKKLAKAKDELSQKIIDLKEINANIYRENKKLDALQRHLISMDVNFFNETGEMILQSSCMESDREIPTVIDFIKLNNELTKLEQDIKIIEHKYNEASRTKTLIRVNHGKILASKLLKPKLHFIRKPYLQLRINAGKITSTSNLLGDKTTF